MILIQNSHWMYLNKNPCTLYARYRIAMKFPKCTYQNVIVRRKDWVRLLLFLPISSEGGKSVVRLLHFVRRLVFRIDDLSRNEALYTNRRWFRTVTSRCRSEDLYCRRPPMEHDWVSLSGTDIRAASGSGVRPRASTSGGSRDGRDVMAE